MSGFAALMGEGGDASDIIELKKKEKAKVEADRVKAEASAAAAFADFKSKAGQSKWAESDDEDDFFSKPVRGTSPAARAARQAHVHCLPEPRRLREL
jgi:hypothetical protein